MDSPILLQSSQTLSKDGSIHVTDEFYNTLISSLGAGLSFIGTILLVYLSIKTHKSWHIFSFSIYGISLVSLFIASALHHGINGSEKTNHFLRQLDYYAIFLTISGTFTPLCLILLRNTLGWSVLCLLWFLAILGIGLKAIFPELPKWLSLAFYVGMGWLGLLVLFPIYQILPQAIYILIVGGFFFTFGAVIYYLERPNPFPGRFGFHEIWHLFVLAGVISHFCVMYFYLLPY